MQSRRGAEVANKGLYTFVLYKSVGRIGGFLRC